MPDMEHLEQDESQFDRILQLCEQAKQDPAAIDQIIAIVTEMKAKDEGEEKASPGMEEGTRIGASKPGFAEKLQEAIAKKQEE